MKQRLLGAAVLIALAIIFVPMFFSNSPPKQDNTTLGLSIPPAPERNFETRNLPVDATPKSASPPTTGAKPAPTADDPNKVTTVTTAAPPTFEAPDQVVATTKPGTATPSATPASKPVVTPPGPIPPPAPALQDDGRFVVNLGVYADAGGAASLVAKVKKLGYPAFAEATQYQGKSAQRVRVGPYADRAAAESVRLKIKQSEEKVPSSVVDLGDSAKSEVTHPESAKGEPGKPDGGKTTKDAPSSPAPSRAGGFTVQLGAFKAEDEANKLRDRLRNGGVSAFIEKSKGAEPTLWKVRAGPYADRAGAETALASVKQKFQLSGMITTQP
ncbi:MAG: SPOR domain-containing protein [Rudaea sp.]